MAPVIAVQNLGQRYGRHWVLRDLTMVVDDGITVLLGPNGAGKTTLLSTIAGLRRPAEGKVSIRGMDTGTAAGRRDIAVQVGYLPQQLGFYPAYTVREFLAYSAWLKKVDAELLDRYVADAESAAKLEQVAHKKMKALSGGTLRRVGLAGALVHKPALLLLDEPASGLDPHQRVEMRRVVRDLAEHTSALISTHHVDDLKVLADQVIVLDGGEVQFQGTPDGLAERGTPDAEGDSALERGYSAVIGHTRVGAPR